MDQCTISRKAKDLVSEMKICNLFIVKTDKHVHMLRMYKRTSINLPHIYEDMPPIMKLAHISWLFFGSPSSDRYVAIGPSS